MTNMEAMTIVTHTQNMKTRGGKREGAGRKKSESSKKMVSFRLAPDVLKYLDSTGRTKAIVVEEALREHRDKQNNN